MCERGRQVGAEVAPGRAGCKFAACLGGRLHTCHTCREAVSPCPQCLPFGKEMAPKTCHEAAPFSVRMEVLKNIYKYIFLYAFLKLCLEM